VSGPTIKLDPSGDSEGNFSVLALKREPFRIDNFSCDYQMVPVGQFQQGENLLVSELSVTFEKFLWQVEEKTVIPYLNNRILKIKNAIIMLNKCDIA